MADSWRHRPGRGAGAVGTAYRSASGQPLAGSLMDYGMPRFDNMPSFETEIAEVLSPTNPFGVKAGGEGGTTPAPAVIMSAIEDALVGVRAGRHRHAGHAAEDLDRDRGRADTPEGRGRIRRAPLGRQLAAEVTSSSRRGTSRPANAPRPDSRRTWRGPGAPGGDGRTGAAGARVQGTDQTQKHVS